MINKIEFFICLILSGLVINMFIKDNINETDILNKIDILTIENSILKNDIIKSNLEYDSIKSIKDSINIELFISNYKLERIKKYNRIAAKGNNIKYLRGWINRVVNE